MANTTAPDDGRRARGARSRHAMITAATTLFSTHGYAGTGISAIAKQAGVNTGSIYHAFGSKEGLLDAVMHSVADRMFAAIKGLPQSPDATAAHHFEAAARLLIADPVFLRLFLLLALEQDGNQSVRAIVESVRTRARDVVVSSMEPALAGIDPTVRPTITAAVGRIALIMLDGIFVSHQLDSEAADLDETLALVSAMTDLAVTQLSTLVEPPATPDTSPPRPPH